MAQFFAHLIDDSFCSERLVLLNARSRDEAVKEVERWFEPEAPQYDMSNGLQEIAIHEVADTISLSPRILRAAAREREREREKAESERQERELYERLKAKYG